MDNVVERIRNKVKKSDLTGDISNFPLEVVQKMCENQVEQGNRFNPKVFQKIATAGEPTGGFTWDDSKEGEDFWAEVILEEFFDLFFKKFNK